jgi:hypothetical protein
MPRGKANNNTEILEYALSHLEKESASIQERIAWLRGRLGLAAAPAPAAAPAATRVAARRGPVKAAPVVASRAKKGASKKRAMNPAARKRISEAQKLRWAEYHRKRAEAAGETAPPAESAASAGQ